MSWSLSTAPKRYAYVSVTAATRRKKRKKLCIRPLGEIDDNKVPDGDTDILGNQQGPPLDAAMEQERQKAEEGECEKNQPVCCRKRKFAI